jgi:hypothetical protein
MKLGRYIILIGGQFVISTSFNLILWHIWPLCKADGIMELG